MFGVSTLKLHVGAVDFGTLTTAKVTVEVVVVGWSRSATDDIWGVKRTTSAEVVLAPSSRYMNCKPIVCPAQPPTCLTMFIFDEFESAIEQPLIVEVTETLTFVKSTVTPLLVIFVGNPLVFPTVVKL